MIDPTQTAELLAIIGALIPLTIWVIHDTEQRVAPLRRPWHGRRIGR